MTIRGQMLRRPFLTALDERARIKGSRDPLGLQSIWVSFARHVVGNLTTVSGSVRDFTTHLLGVHFAHELNGSDSSELDVFLRWEQLAAYARVYVNKDGAGLRGVERVREHIDGDEVRISSGRRWQILSDQKTYGLWGLYTGPSSESGIVATDPLRPTDAGIVAIEEQYMPLLAKDSTTRKVVEFLRKDGKRLDLDADLLGVLAGVLSPKLRGGEKRFYDEHLVCGGPRDRTGGRQRLLAELVTRRGIPEELTTAELRGLAKDAHALGELGEQLASLLERIRRCDALIGPAGSLFGFLLDRDGATLDTLTGDVRKVWRKGLESAKEIDVCDLVGEIADASSDDIGRRWVVVAEALPAGDYATAIREVIAINGDVMKSRGSGPWMALDGEKLRVSFRAEPSDLPSPSDLRTSIRYPYFLPTLTSVTRRIRGAA